MWDFKGLEGGVRVVLTGVGGPDISLLRSTDNTCCAPYVELLHRVKSRSDDVRLSSSSLRVLRALASYPDHQFSGADISKALGIPSGTLYPILLRFERMGVVTSSWEELSASELGRPRRRYYMITRSGSLVASQEEERLSDVKVMEGRPAWVTG